MANTNVQLYLSSVLFLAFPPSLSVCLFLLFFLSRSFLIAHTHTRTLTSARRHTRAVSCRVFSSLFCPVVAYYLLIFLFFPSCAGVKEVHPLFRHHAASSTSSWAGMSRSSFVFYRITCQRGQGQRGRERSEGEPCQVPVSSCLSLCFLLQVQPLLPSLLILSSPVSCFGLLPLPFGTMMTPGNAMRQRRAKRGEGAKQKERAIRLVSFHGFTSPPFFNKSLFLINLSSLGVAMMMACLYLYGVK